MLCPGSGIPKYDPSGMRQRRSTSWADSRTWVFHPCAWIPRAICLYPSSVWGNSCASNAWFQSMAINIGLPFLRCTPPCCSSDFNVFWCSGSARDDLKAFRSSLASPKFKAQVLPPTFPAAVGPGVADRDVPVNNRLDLPDKFSSSGIRTKLHLSTIWPFFATSSRPSVAASASKTCLIVASGGTCTITSFGSFTCATFTSTTAARAPTSKNDVVVFAIVVWELPALRAGPKNDPGAKCNCLSTSWASTHHARLQHTFSHRCQHLREAVPIDREAGTLERSPPCDRKKSRRRGPLFESAPAAALQVLHGGLKVWCAADAPELLQEVFRLVDGKALATGRLCCRTILQASCPLEALEGTGPSSHRWRVGA